MGDPVEGDAGVMAVVQGSLEAEYVLSYGEIVVELSNEISFPGDVFAGQE